MRGRCPERFFAPGALVKTGCGGCGGSARPPTQIEQKKSSGAGTPKLLTANLMEGGMLSTEPKPTEFALQDAPQARLALDNIAFNVSRGRALNRFALRNNLRAFSSVSRVCTCGLALQWDAGF